MTKMYLIQLTGQGDTQLCLVSKEQWDYLNSPLPEFPEGKYCVQETPPACTSSPQGWNPEDESRREPTRADESRREPWRRSPWEGPSS